MPTWSPDGRYVAYVTWSRDGGQIFRVSPDGGRPEQLTRRAAYYALPVYSPDSQKIVFGSGATSDQLFADLNFHDPDVISDGAAEPTEITEIGKRTGVDLRWIPASGGDSTLIGPAQGGRSPHFTSDPNRVYLTT